MAPSLVMQTYWAATGRVWQLRNAANQIADVEQREALMDLLVVEESRQATARRLLAKVWGIHL